MCSRTASAIAAAASWFTVMPRFAGFLLKLARVLTIDGIQNCKNQIADPVPPLIVPMICAWF
jgi:hypothetical protein